MKQKAFILEVYVSDSNKECYLLREMIQGGTRPLAASSSLDEVKAKVAESVSSMFAPKEDNQ